MSSGEVVRDGLVCDLWVWNLAHGANIQHTYMVNSQKALSDALRARLSSDPGATVRPEEIGNLKFNAMLDELGYLATLRSIPSFRGPEPKE